MPYTSQNALNQRFGSAEIDGLLDRDNSGVADTQALAAVIGDADALINGYVGVRYVLPLAYTPALLGNLAADVVRYKLYDDRASEEVRRRYEDAIETLRELAAGDLVLPPDVNGTPASTSIAFAGYSADRVFDADTLEPYVGY